MEDLFDSLFLGQKIEYKGKTYIRLKSINPDLVLAVEKDTALPAQVFLIPAEKDIEK